MAKAYPAKIRLSQGSRSSFCSAKPPSLAPRPRPPYFVVVGSDVFRYESYCWGQFWPQSFGSVVSSVTSTTRTNGCRASCLRSKMFVRSARSSTVTPAIPTSASTAMSQPPRHPFMSFLRPSATGAVSGVGMAVQAIEAAMGATGRVDHRLDETVVTPHTVDAHHVAVARRDLDRLLEVLECEGDGVAKAVLALGQPLRDSG